MKITTRLEIPKSDEDKFMEKVDAYVKYETSELMMTDKKQELITYHRQQMNTAFRLGLDERIRKTKKEV